MPRQPRLHSPTGLYHVILKSLRCRSKLNKLIAGGSGSLTWGGDLRCRCKVFKLLVGFDFPLREFGAGANFPNFLTSFNRLTKLSDSFTPRRTSQSESSTVFCTSR